MSAGSGPLLILPPFTPGGTGDVSYFNKTYVEVAALIGTSGLSPYSFYVITDRSIIVQASANNQLSKQAIYLDSGTSETDYILYDFTNDWIEERRDGRGNVVRISKAYYDTLLTSEDPYGWFIWGDNDVYGNYISDSKVLLNNSQGGGTTYNGIFTDNIITNRSVCNFSTATSNTSNSIKNCILSAVTSVTVTSTSLGLFTINNISAFGGATCSITVGTGTITFNNLLIFTLGTFSFNGSISTSTTIAGIKIGPSATLTISYTVANDSSLSGINVDTSSTVTITTNATAAYTLIFVTNNSTVTMTNNSTAITKIYADNSATLTFTSNTMTLNTVICKYGTVTISNCTGISGTLINIFCENNSVITLDSIAYNLSQLIYNSIAAYDVSTITVSGSTGLSGILRLIVRNGGSFSVTSNTTAKVAITIEGRSFTALPGTAIASPGMYLSPGSLNDQTAIFTSAINPMTVLSRHNVVHPTMAGAPFVINLPPWATFGPPKIIKDYAGVAGLVNTITIVPASGTIDGAANYVINAAYGAVIIYSDGTNGFALVV